MIFVWFCGKWLGKSFSVDAVLPVCEGCMVVKCSSGSVARNERLGRCMIHGPSLAEPCFAVAMILVSERNLWFAMRRNPKEPSMDDDPWPWLREKKSTGNAAPVHEMETLPSPKEKPEDGKVTVNAESPALAKERRDADSAEGIGKTSMQDDGLLAVWAPVHIENWAPNHEKTDHSHNPSEYAGKVVNIPPRFTGKDFAVILFLAVPILLVGGISGGLTGILIAAFFALFFVIIAALHFASTDRGLFQRSLREIGSLFYSNAQSKQQAVFEESGKAAVLTNVPRALAIDRMDYLSDGVRFELTSTSVRVFVGTSCRKLWLSKISEIQVNQLSSHNGVGSVVFYERDEPKGVPAIPRASPVIVVAERSPLFLADHSGIPAHPPRTVSIEEQLCTGELTFWAVDNPGLIADRVFRQVSSIDPNAGGSYR